MSGLPLTVGEQLDIWLAAQRLEASTRASYESAMRFWKAALGQTALRSLTLTQCLTALASRPRLTGKTVNNYVLVLRQAIALAVMDKVVSENVALHIPRQHQSRRWPVTTAEADAVIADMARTRPSRNYAEAKFFTGMARRNRRASLADVDCVRTTVTASRPRRREGDDQDQGREAGPAQ